MSDLTFAQVDQTVLNTLKPAGKTYWALVALLFAGVLMGASCWLYQIFVGVGVAGMNNPVAWGTYLINFVFWVGIAHSGTLISAILHLFRAGWRNPIARAAETMTVFAVCTAGLFPFIHLGRAWMVYYMLPFPNQRLLWPNFQSPLMFDVVAISTYLIVSSLFWYTGMLPDLAIVRDNATGFRKKVFTVLSMGWTGRFEQWRHYTRGYLFFAALATPLVISVHSVVSWDFALAVVPGWHTTIFAPYFVAGAIHSGLATEFFIAWYSHNPLEQYIFAWRPTGDYAVGFWIMAICNTIIPLLFLFKQVRTSIAALFVISIIVNIGMWYERFVIIITSVARDFIPHNWGLFAPSMIEYGIMIGAFSLFFFLFFLFVKHMPSVSMTEVKEMLE